ncbi:UNVERIFIED_CONTAM: hypothetical protein PYX00_002742 [Menopon gallinae]|uniref:lysozyme n=1 Tax=Menopon gallinae TaxID=328185 RepID=A0AAW2HXU3_9NEOP
MLFVQIALLFLFASAPALTVHVSNLDVTCLKCICTASTGCNENFSCSPEGFCGPFFISRKYWEDAGSLTLGASSKYSLDGGYNDCTKNFQCASNVVTNYMAENGWDCNDDGVTDCDDYARIHFLGPERCDQSIENSLYYKRYLSCRPPKAADTFSQV